MNLLAISPLLGLLALAAPLSAAPLQKTTAEAASQDDVGRQIDAVLAEYDSVYLKWYEKYLAARGEIAEAIPDATAYGPRLMALAARDPQCSEAFSACTFVIQRIGQGESNTAAIDHVAAHFLGHEGVGDLIGGVRGGPDANNRLLKAAIEKCASAKLQAKACYNLASGLKFQLDRENPSPDEAARIEAQADKYFALCLEGAYAHVLLSNDITIGTKSRGDVFEMKNLRAGKPAPDIDGEDIDGVAFKLSDYRGKVVMLDFWGDW